tara:strand:- start:4721 stop:5797 length:1077 start_codon:yes stop_codon:yes gene_type:complete
MKIKTITLTLVFSTFLSLHCPAGPPANYEGERDVRAEYSDFKNHHLLDNHSFKLFKYETEEGTKYVSFPLPIILWDNGIQTFLSSRFYFGKKVVEHNNGSYYKLYHNKIYKTDELGTINYDENDKVLNEKPLDFSITKNVVLILICLALMMVIFGRMAKSYKNNPMPTGIGRLLEPIVLYIRDDIARPNIGEKHYKRYMSFLLTVFFFIWIVNLFGLTPIGSNVTNNIAVTASLAVLTYLITTFTANKGYWGHIFWMPGVPVPMKILLAPIELLGTIIKPFSLMIRLYANITAGHVVLMSILGLIFIFKNLLGGTLSFGLAFALSLLELLVCALQAYIFTMLSALYFGSAVEEHHDEH